MIKKKKILKKKKKTLNIVNVSNNLSNENIIDDFINYKIQKIVESGKTQSIRIVMQSKWVNIIKKENITIKGFITSLISMFINDIINTSKLKKLEHAIIKAGGGKKNLYKKNNNLIHTKILIFNWQYDYLNQINVSNVTNIIYLMCESVLSKIN